MLVILIKGMPGIARINLSPLTQKIIGCVIGENVTTEYPWVYVKKEDIEDNLDLHDKSSDFLPIRDHINLFPDKNILIGYAPTSDTDGQFYICLTEAGRDAVIKNIEALRIDQENRVRNAVYKIPSTWQDLGSGQEVDDTIVKNTRPLFEIEVRYTHSINEIFLTVNFTPHFSPPLERIESTIDSNFVTRKCLLLRGKQSRKL